MQERKIDCLDFGYVKLVASNGDDQAIVGSARVSYSGEGTKTTRDDEKLIDYLMRNQHTSPFEIVNFTFEMKLPIFVARQMIRHRTARLNEMSARYSVLPEEYYVPEVSRMNPQSKTNKQGSETEVIEDAEELRRAIKLAGAESFALYQKLLDAGLSRELARIVLPLNTYTAWVWQMDLKNLMHFLKLRMDSHAQYEIRVYADAMYELIKPIVPITMEAFERNIINGAHFSNDELNMLRDALEFDWMNDAMDAKGFSASQKLELRKKLRCD